MDFFASQDQARKKTGRLILLFIVAVILMIVALHFVTATAITMIQIKTQSGVDSHVETISPFVNPIVIGGVAVVTLLIVFLGSAYKTAQLSSGGHVVAEMLGGKRIQPDTTDLDRKSVV